MPEFDEVQIVSLVGALLILGAYGANQAGALTTRNIAYSALNFVGASVLAWVAVISTQYGFIVLEGAWAIVSLVALIRRLRPPAAAH